MTQTCMHTHTHTQTHTLSIQKPRTLIIISVTHCMLHIGVNHYIIFMKGEWFSKDSKYWLKQCTLNSTDQGGV